MAGRASRKGTTATGTRCPSCRASILRQEVGPLPVVADLTPLTPEQQTAARKDPNRLVWCLPATRWTERRLRWISPSVHPADCPNDHVACHRCPPPPSRIF